MGNQNYYCEKVLLQLFVNPEKKKMVYFIKLLVASSKTPQTSHALFLPLPLNTNTVSQPVIAYQNGNTLYISSPKHFAYSCIGSNLLC